MVLAFIGKVSKIENGGVISLDSKDFRQMIASIHSFMICM
jgi:hypothetical protein